MKNKDIIWFEKYRPTNFNDIVKQEEIKLFLDGAIKTRNIPHLLFHGPAGTGKTTVANIIINTLFKVSYENNKYVKNDIDLILANKKMKSERVLELNASGERGINIVRNKIKIFASLTVNNNINFPPFKIIILDEADVLSAEAQFALRNIMETYSSNTRFIMICNNITKIITPITSRCTKFNFLPIDLIESKKTILKILFLESGNNININDDIYEYIYNYTEGDMRKTITLFQRLYGSFDLNNITMDNVQYIIGEIPNEIIENIITVIKNTNSTSKNINSLILYIVKQGFNCLFLLNHLYTYFLNDDIDDKRKGLIISKISEINYKLNNGGNEYIHILNLLLFINCTYCNYTFTITQNPLTII